VLIVLFIFAFVCGCFAFVCGCVRSFAVALRSFAVAFVCLCYIIIKFVIIFYIVKSIIGQIYLIYTKSRSIPLSSKKQCFNRFYIFNFLFNLNISFSKLRIISFNPIFFVSISKLFISSIVNLVVSNMFLYL